MTNGERIQTILDVDRDCTEVHGENGTMTFTVTQDFWNAEYKEPTTKNDLGVDCISRDDVRDVMQELWGTSGELMDRLMALPSVTPQYSSGLEKNSKKLEKDFGELDCISREQALVAIRNLYPGMPRVDFNGSLRKWVDKYRPYIECDDAIKQLPSVTPQEPRCKDCKWWKDSDGVYRRGCGAESQCPINRREVFEGNGYCYLFEPQESEG